MIYLFNANEVDFIGGTPLVNAYEDIIVEEINGRYDLSFNYPCSDKSYKLLERFKLCYADTPQGKQAFSIVSVDKHVGYVSVYALHVFFMLDKTTVGDITTTSPVNCTEILKRLKKSLTEENRYSFYSDIKEGHVFNISKVSPLKALGEGKHSILGQWGGYLKRDNYSVGVVSRLGVDTEHLIAKRKNIADLSLKQTGEAIVTRLYLTAKLKDSEAVIETVVDSPLINTYPYIMATNRSYENEDIKSLEDLIKIGKAEFSKMRIDLPKETFTITATEEINGYGLNLGDSVLILYEDYDLSKRIEVSSYEYIPMAKRYKSLSFGELENTFTGAVTGSVSDKVDEAVKIGESAYTRAVEAQTELITKLTAGHVVKLDGELLVTDDEDYKRARNVWKWSVNGLGFSSNGYSGPYETAITMDGHINAKALTGLIVKSTDIQAGAIKANHLSLDSYTSLTSTVINDEGLRLSVRQNAKAFIDALRAEVYERIDAEKHIIISDSQPKDTTKLWVDISTPKKELRKWDGVSWAYVTTNDRLKSLEGVIAKASEESDNRYEELNKKTSFSVTKDELIVTTDRLEKDLKSKDEELRTITNNIHIGSGKIRLGDNLSDAQMELSKDKLTFTVGNVPRAWLTNEHLYAENLRAEKALYLGNFAFIPRANGNLSFKKVK